MTTQDFNNNALQPAEKLAKFLVFVSSALGGSETAVDTLKKNHNSVFLPYHSFEQLDNLPVFKHLEAECMTYNIGLKVSSGPTRGAAVTMISVHPGEEFGNGIEVTDIIAARNDASVPERSSKHTTTGKGGPRI